MQTPSTPAERIAFWKDAKRQLIQHHVDIDRLWRLSDQMSIGVPLGGNGTMTVTTTTTTTTLPPCDGCNAQYQFSISGITNRSGSTCDTALNGSWTVDKIAAQCAWGQDPDTVGGCCGGESDRFRLELESGGTFLLLYCTTGGYPYWRSEPGQVCDGTEPITLTLVDDHDFVGVPSTITITPL
jgi:hypothetical protein